MGNADDLRQLQRDPEMMRYFGDGHPYSDDESRMWLKWHVAMWDLEGYGFWAVEHKVAGIFIGWLGMTKVWDPPELLPSTEVGWFIDRRNWGQGLATEGAREALSFAFGPLRLVRVIARYDLDNIASGRVMAKIGMRFWKDMPHAELSGATIRVHEKGAG